MLSDPQAALEVAAGSASAQHKGIVGGVLVVVHTFTAQKHLVHINVCFGNNIIGQSTVLMYPQCRPQGEVSKREIKMDVTRQELLGECDT